MHVVHNQRPRGQQGRGGPGAVVRVHAELEKVARPDLRRGPLELREGGRPEHRVVNHVLEALEGKRARGRAHDHGRAPRAVFVVPLRLLPGALLGPLPEDLVQEPVVEEAEHDDGQAAHVGARERLRIRHEREGKRNVAQGHEEGHHEVEQVGRPELEHEDDEDVVELVEDEVGRCEDERRRPAVVRRVHGGGGQLGYRVVANVAQPAVVGVLGHLADGDARHGRRRDGQRDGDDELVHGHKTVEVDGVDVYLGERALLVHGGEAHGHAGEDEHRGPEHRVAGEGVAVVPAAVLEGGPEDVQDAENHDRRARVLCRAVARVERQP
mmetsp:Transcript_16409/g.55210  ORF Transcript_16409/g.55210 Transcript_16409/m.55210 type:complete len:325 (+) Transcript_16409:583-1557(+)